MKYQISSMDLHFLCKELDATLNNVKADKIFQPERKEFLFLLHISGEGKQILRIKLPNFIFLTEFKGDMPEIPKDFCMVLRKYISGKRLVSIKQVGFERILEMAFESKEEEYRLIVELFSPGNIILTDKEYKIISVLEARKFKDRTLRGNVKYEFPEKRNNPQELDEAEFAKIISASDKESVVKALALDFSLGGAYAEELCVRAGVAKDKKDLSITEIAALYSALQNLLNSKLEPNAVYKDEKPFMILPIAFETLKQYETKQFTSFNEALDTILTSAAIEDEQEKELEPHKKEIEKLKKQIEQQKEQIAELDQIAEDSQRRGELLYENYVQVKDIVTEINKARAKYSFKEIKEKLKDHKVVKEINEKDKTVSVEL